MENVATIADCASVIEGVSWSRNALLNGDTKNYDWDSGYKCHQLGSGAIVVQLAQPYMIGSIRLLLWDCDDQSYSYYVEVSTNQQQWTMCPEQQSGQKEENSEELGTEDSSSASQQLNPHTLQAPSGNLLPPSPGFNSLSSNRQHQ
ncbi:BTB/POZ domain-containing protein 9 [Camelus dromedarius]|uniref:BTB/POZ domain-containing protein 9 n=1 Tax=Camelus dromedarius TaxID=9838 RepID=A0A5N4CYH3_CAMDR|nr:BTB/POZ domain-containing protein 9 [Camelus dromedarius]